MTRSSYTVNLVFTNFASNESQEIKLGITHLQERIPAKKSQAIRLAYKHIVGYNMDPEQSNENALEEIKAFCEKSNRMFQIILNTEFRTQDDDYVWHDDATVDILYSTH